jgi:hypothetical protein
MALFSKILGKLGIGENGSAASAADPRKTGLKVDTSSAPAAPGSSSSRSAQATMTEVDVVAQLEQKAAAHPEKLNWRTSIVDLLKLLDIDSSLSARKELAKELNAPRELKDGSAEMNTWLHKTVLQRIAANGGNVPRELLD